MKLLSTLLKKGIFTRLLFTFLLVVIPICLLGINFLNLGMKAVKKEISNSMQAQINFYLENFEKEMYRIRFLQSDLINDSNLNKLSNIPKSMDLYDRTEAVLNLRQRLLAIMNSSTYIKDVFAVITATDDVIHASSGISKMTDDERELLKVDTGKSRNYFIYWKGRLFLSFMQPLEFSKDSSPPQFTIVVELSEKELKSALKQFNDYEGSGAILINSLQDYILSTEANTDVVMQLKKSIGELTGKSKIDAELLKTNGFLVFCATSPHSNLILARYVPEKFIFESIKDYKNWLWVFSAVSIIIIILFSYSTYKYIHEPILKLVDSFRKVENGDLNVLIEHKHQDEFRYLYKRFNAMVENVRILIDQVYIQKIFAQKAELKHLQSQINPHFLYNSYFILYNMVENEDYDSTKIFVKQLGSYFQYITRSASDEVALSMEVAHARIYAEIQAKRFRSRIYLEFEELPVEYENIIVPRLILQPIIENAFEHGLEHKLENGIVKISFSILNNILYIAVEDNGSGMSELEYRSLQEKISDNVEGVEITGILNIHRRIQMKFGPPSGLEARLRDEGGLKISIKINLQGENVKNA